MMKITINSENHTMHIRDEQEKSNDGEKLAENSFINESENEDEDEDEDDEIEHMTNLNQGGIKINLLHQLIH